MEYTLKRGGLTAVVTDQGGELISLRDAAGLEYIWQGTQPAGRAGAPFCSPLWALCWTRRSASAERPST